jgi:hypothetical protein
MIELNFAVGQRHPKTARSATTLYLPRFTMNTNRQALSLSRRELLRAAGIGLFGVSASGWFPVFAEEATRNPGRRRHCVLLWMAGGPSQTDTFDMKPGHVNGGEFKEIETNVPGLRICEHLPRLAAMGDQLVPLRGLVTKEGDHGRGTFVMRTGHQPTGPIHYPTLGSALSKELGTLDAELPNYVSIAPYQLFEPRAFGPGFLGPQYGPLTVGAGGGQPAQAENYAQLGVDDLRMPGGVTQTQADARLGLWRTLQGGFLSRHRTASPLAHDTVYQRAIRMMRSETAKAFDLSEEPATVRDAYGRGRFGQGCLMARRLIERGVPFVEVTLGTFADNNLGWDTHTNNFATVKNLCGELDAGWGTLMSELKQRGLLDSTTFLWLGEFGRTPRINPNGGRDHFPAAWTAVLAGGGVKGGQAYGRTSDDGMTVEEGKISVGDLLATLCQAVGVRPDRSNISDLGRPIKLAEGEPIAAVLA